jgi:RNA 2',3'-cyclic 3'-phosphodiesterase
MCDAAGVRRDERPPRFHVTVGRPKRAPSPAERRAAIAWAKSKPPVGARIVIDRLALYTWSENRKERQFRIVRERPLQSAGAGLPSR